MSVIGGTMSLFVYRDVFFRMEGLDGNYALYVEMATPGSSVCVRMWDYRPPLSEVRCVCDEHVDRLVNESTRASADCTCDECERPYREHPYFRGAFAFGEEGPYLRRLCDGRLVKL